jgi:3-deoxy-manno-octulosonate cytidylyltransferase (CMP-KDO synthetase)
MSAGYHIVIPARMASQRLPGKPLIAIGGRSLLEHVWRRACKASAQSIVIATDSDEIHDAVTRFGGDAVMTSTDHQSGSDRIAECVDIMGWPDDTLVVNLQGDEPLMPPACLDQVASILQNAAGADVASLYWPVDTPEAVHDSNVVKVVVSGEGRALYFSRSVIPHPRNVSVEAAL